MITLGIESSCDETSAAILDNGKVLANRIYSQLEHARYGGVVPEIASRAHLEKIGEITDMVLRETSLRMADIGLIAVTDSPGLAGALLVGISFSLGMHLRHGIPVTGINHLEGHLSSVLLTFPDVRYPFLGLVASGGHTAIYRVEAFGEYQVMGQAIDDAAGEAFDKVGKLLGFAYPAGRSIEMEAQTAPQDEPLSFPVARLSNGSLDFSFSGLKTAVKYYIARKDQSFLNAHRGLICKAFQKAVVDSLVANLRGASERTGIPTIAIAGGVACNGALRRELSAQFGDSVYFPPPSLCTDNAAMIAMAGFERHRRGTCRFPRMDPARGI